LNKKKDEKQTARKRFRSSEEGKSRAIDIQWSS